MKPATEALPVVVRRPAADDLRDRYRTIDGFVGPDPDLDEDLDEWGRTAADRSWEEEADLRETDRAAQGYPTVFFGGRVEHSPVHRPYPDLEEGWQ